MNEPKDEIFRPINGSQLSAGHGRQLKGPAFQTHHGIFD